MFCLMLLEYTKMNIITSWIGNRKCTKQKFKFRLAEPSSPLITNIFCRYLMLYLLILFYDLKHLGSWVRRVSTTREYKYTRLLLLLFTFICSHKSLLIPASAFLLLKAEPVQELLAVLASGRLNPATRLMFYILDNFFLQNVATEWLSWQKTPKESSTHPTLSPFQTGPSLASLTIWNEKFEAASNGRGACLK